MNLHHARDTNTTEQNSTPHSPLREKVEKQRKKERMREFDEANESGWFRRV